MGSFVEEAAIYTINDVMVRLNAQFTDVKNHLSVIYNHMLKQGIDAYREVEDAVTAASNGIMTL